MAEITIDAASRQVLAAKVRQYERAGWRRVGAVRVVEVVLVEAPKRAVARYEQRMVKRGEA